MRICTYNILNGGIGRADPLAEVLRLARAQVVVVQEAWDVEWFHRLADALEMDRFLAEHPTRKEGRAAGAVGLLCGADWEIREAMNLAAMDARLTRGGLCATVRKAGEDRVVLGVHLHARETFADEQVRLNEVEAVLEWGRKLLRDGKEHVLCGDFNAAHPLAIVDIGKLRAKSRARLEAQGAVIPREAIARVLAAGYVDAHAIGRTPAQFDVSMTTAHPALRTDYIFVTPGLLGQVKSCTVMKTEMGRFASDHYPVVLEMDDHTAFI